MERKNTLKNSVLLILFVLMIFLTAMAWLSALDMSSVPDGSLISKIYQRVTYGVSGFKVRTDEQPAAMPTRIAISIDGETIGAQYHAASVSVLYDALANTVSAPLASDTQHEYVFDNEVKNSFSGDVIYFGYEGYLPIELLCAWLGESSVSSEKADAYWLCGDGKLYIHTENGYICKNTDYTRDKWQISLEQLPINECSFAAQSEYSENIRPDTLIFEHDAVNAQVIELKNTFDNQQASNMSAILSTFEYDLHANSYEENDGETMVYVEDYSTLRMSQNGNIEFHALAEEGGLTLGGDPRQANILSVRADYAYTFLREIQNSVGDTSLAMLYDVSIYEDNLMVMTFIQTVGGIPVQSETPFAEISFQNNRMVSANINLKIFTQTDEISPLIPAKQVIAAANDKKLRFSSVYQLNDGKYTVKNGYQW